MSKKKLCKKRIKKICSFKGIDLVGGMEERNDFHDIRKLFCETLDSEVDKRFPKDSTDVVFAMRALGMRNLSFLSTAERAEYGNKEIEILTDFYGRDRNIDGEVHPAIVDQVETKAEWNLLKNVVLQEKYPRDQMFILWGLIIQFHGQTFHNLTKLAMIAMITPLQTADCERGFSAQNNLHTPARN